MAARGAGESEGDLESSESGEEGGSDEGGSDRSEDEESMAVMFMQGCEADNGPVLELTVLRPTESNNGKPLVATAAGTIEARVKRAGLSIHVGEPLD